MDDTRESQQGGKRLIAKIDLEATAYFLFGTILAGFGLVALIRWSATRWLSGERGLVLAVTGGAALGAWLALFALRRHRRILLLAGALACVGAVAYGLANFGFNLPASWFE